MMGCFCDIFTTMFTTIDHCIAETGLLFSNRMRTLDSQEAFKALLDLKRKGRGFFIFLSQYINLLWSICMRIEQR